MPDARKGERIVLLTTQKDAERSAMQRQAKADRRVRARRARRRCRVVDKVPLLGTGKTDYVGATALAKELAERAQPIELVQPTEPAQPTAQQVA